MLRNGVKMYLRILKRDLKRKKTMNLILFLFIILATTFLASSVNNLLTVNNAVDDYLEAANPGDVMILSTSEESNQKISDYLEHDDKVVQYEPYYLLLINTRTVSLYQNGKKNDDFVMGSSSILSMLPDNYMKVFDENGDKIELKNGEIAILKKEADANHIHIGDILHVEMGEVKKDFTVQYIMKDAVFGPNMMGFSRFIVTDEDFEEVFTSSGTEKMSMYSADVTEKRAFLREFRKQGFSISTIIEKSSLSRAYIMDYLVSLILIIVSACMIGISFLILRFTIIFTLQEDFKEIGVMKALGLRNSGIKKLYLMKYFIISLVGAFIGFLISIPFGNVLLKQAIANIQIENTGNFPYVNLLCASVIIVIVITFCFFVCGKLKKFSAMEAIRDGSNGENFQKIGKIALYKRKRLPNCLYLAINDVVSHIRRYIVLILTFCLGTLLILLPLSAANTLASESVIDWFGFARSDLYIDTGELDKIIQERDDEKLQASAEKVQNQLSDIGIDSEVYIEIGFYLTLFTEDNVEPQTVFTFQNYMDVDTEYLILNGEQPELSNEITLTEQTASNLGVNIGDTVQAKLGEEELEFVVCGLFQSMNNLGDGARISPSMDVDLKFIGGLFPFQINIKNGMSIKEAEKRIQEAYPEYEVRNSMEYLKEMMGDIVDQIGSMEIITIILVIGMNMLITILMMKAFLARERSEIAMLKSIGFKNRSIRIWQTIRLLFVMVIALILGILLSLILDDYTMLPIFGIMGADKVTLVVNPVEILVKYPIILLITTGIAAFWCTRDVKKIDEKEVNNME